MSDTRNEALRYFVLLLIVAVPLFSIGLTNHGLWSADEPRVAEIGREMALSGNWAVPTLNQKPFLEEPPLYYATLALTFKTLGVSDKVARIPSAVFALAAVLIAFLVANMFFGPRVALLTGVILATAGEYFRVAHWVIVDGALAFFVMGTLYCFARGYLSKTGGHKLVWYVLLYMSCTLAFYTKGFIGLVIPGLSILAFLIFEKNLREIVTMRLWLGILIFFAMTLPWFIALWHQAGTEYLNVFFVHNHLQRFLPVSLAGKLSDAASGHHKPFYYYIKEFPNGFLPWGVFLIPVFIHAFSRSNKSVSTNLPSERGIRFAKCWFFAGILFLSAASTKRTLYLMPIFAPAAMLTAVYISHTIDGISGSKWLKKSGSIFMWVFDVAILVIGLGLVPIYFSVKNTYALGTFYGLLVSLITLSVMLLAFSFASIRYRLRHRMKPYWVLVNGSIISLLIFSVAVVAPILDLHKSFVPFSREVAARAPAGTPLYAYQPDETLRGAVPFYTGRKVVEIEDVGQIVELLNKHESIFVMIRDKKEETEKKLLKIGGLFVAVKQTMGTNRTLVLLSNTPVGAPLIIRDRFQPVAKEKAVESAPSDTLLQMFSSSLERI